MELPIRCAHTEIVDISTLKPHPKNDNVHSEEQIELFVDILRYQGQRRAITVSTRSQFITKGHGLLMALQKMGVKKAAVDRQEYQTEAQELADIAADNELARLAVVDPLKRRELMLALPEGFNLRLLGAPALKLPDAPVTPGCDEDEAPEVKPDPKVKLGELYELGVHRVLCGDSTVKENVERLMAGEKADMVFTDPPYGISLDRRKETRAGVLADGRERRQHSYALIHGDDRPYDPSPVLRAFEYCREVFLWGANHYCDKLPVSPKASWIVWDRKVTETADQSLASDFELCWSKNPHKYAMARVTWHGPFGHNKRDDGDNRVHPTQKPVKLAEWFFERWGKGHTKVADLFLGSGSTLIACEKTSRRCFGMEIAPEYVQVVLERFQKFSGKKAHRLNPDGTKTLWDDIRDGKDQPPKTVTRKKP